MSALIPLIKGLIAATLVAVVAVLFVGFFAMIRGGTFNARWGNRLMRWRVILQGVAVALFAALMVMMITGDRWSS